MMLHHFSWERYYSHAHNHEPGIGLRSSLSEDQQAPAVCVSCGWDGELTEIDGQSICVECISNSLCPWWN